MREDANERLRVWHSLSAVLTASRNIVEKTATLTIGRLAVSGKAERCREALWRRSPLLAPPQVRAAVVAHVFYPELVPELLRCHRWFPPGSPLHLTTTVERRGSVAAAASGYPNLHIHVLPNRGRDIAPFLHVLSSGWLDDVDAVLKLHTKRSIHLMDGDIRRRLLYLALAGGPARLHRILTLFEVASTGVIGWGPSYRRGQYFWQRNRTRGGRAHCADGRAARYAARLFRGLHVLGPPGSLAAPASTGLGLRDLRNRSGTDGRRLASRC